jgi:hypothetical protein
MDRDRDQRYSGKRSFAEVSEADREYELSVRRRALDNDDRCRRERERPRSPQWRRDDPRPHDDYRRPDAGASAPRGAWDEPPRRHYKTVVSKQRKQASVDVTSQDVRLEIKRTQKCALHSCIENLGNFRAFK